MIYLFVCKWSQIPLSSYKRFRDHISLKTSSRCFLLRAERYFINNRKVENVLEGCPLSSGLMTKDSLCNDLPPYIFQESGTVEGRLHYENQDL